jgi:hypothetical protein
MEEMGMDETQMILALRALRELLDNGDRDDEDELVASYRALGKAIVKNKPMTRKDRTRVAKYLREAGLHVWSAAAQRLGISRTAWLHAASAWRAGDDADEGQPKGYVTAITQKTAGSCNLEPRLLGGGRPK